MCTSISRRFIAGKSSKGFTLIELLVVIAIIGILASIVLASLNTARKKGRDARRISDMSQIKLALELYYDAQSSVSYPVSAGGANVTLSTTAGTPGAAIAPLYIATVPIDPTAGGNYNYQYQSLTPGATPTICAAASCLAYIVADALENGAAPSYVAPPTPSSGITNCGATAGATYTYCTTN